MTIAVRGLLAGVVATAGMSALMLAGRRLGLTGGMPPERITARLLDAAGVDRSRREQDVLAAFAHLAFGGAAGALFAPLARTLRPLPAALTGVGFGALVWSISYQGWVPALGIMPPASRDRPGRPQVMLGAHLVYGALLGVLSRPKLSAVLSSRT